MPWGGGSRTPRVLWLLQGEAQHRGGEWGDTLTADSCLQLKRLPPPWKGPHFPPFWAEVPPLMRGHRGVTQQGVAAYGHRAEGQR